VIGARTQSSDRSELEIFASFCTFVHDIIFIPNGYTGGMISDQGLEPNRASVDSYFFPFHAFSFIWFFLDGNRAMAPADLLLAIPLPFTLAV